MEPNLKNSCYVDRSVLRKAYAQILRVHTLVMLVFSLLFLAIWVFYLVVVPAAERELMLTVILPVLVLINAAISLLAPRQNARIVIKRLHESRQVKEFESTLVFTPEEVLMRFDYSQDQIRLPYQEIRKVLAGRDLLLLKTRAKQFYLLDRTRFENGDEADFWKLMNEKCPKAVPNKHRPGQPKA